MSEHTTHIAVHIVLSINSAAALPVIHMYIYNDESIHSVLCYGAATAIVAAIGSIIAAGTGNLDCSFHCILRRTEGMSSVVLMYACNTARSMHTWQSSNNYQRIACFVV
jgi:hypothetical protein